MQNPSPGPNKFNAAAREYLARADALAGRRTRPHDHLLYLAQRIDPGGALARHADLVGRYAMTAAASRWLCAVWYDLYVQACNAEHRAAGSPLDRLAHAGRKAGL